MIILNHELIVIHHMKEIWIGLLCCMFIIEFYNVKFDKFSYDSEEPDCNAFIGTWETIAHK